MLGDAAHPLVARIDQTEHQKQRVKELRKVIDDAVFKKRFIVRMTLNLELFFPTTLENGMRMEMNCPHFVLKGSILL